LKRGKGEVLTVATIQSELGSRFQITGMGSIRSSNELALLLRAGALAAPMESSKNAPSARNSAPKTSRRAALDDVRLCRDRDFHDRLLHACSASSACWRWPATCCC
jgi:hypothetical protein